MQQIVVDQPIAGVRQGPVDGWGGLRAERSWTAPGGGLLLALRLEVCDLDRDVEGIDDLACRGRDSGCADDRCDRGKHTADLLGVDSDLACRFEVQQIRHRRRIDRGKRCDANECQRL